ncbi:penicillin-insensitive murein endopeptidase [Myxococcota bacterium]|nr:penicillin-insensitive murein endopeptidase [Myxococcota bacterium]MBU1432321.1 penicillin-insensitive murein endopeptidase [Myxococcota bacterium]MBU1897041.1 penicillin-insensitive murein endopeptidase [Myxococcota bacterium]
MNPLWLTLLLSLPTPTSWDGYLWVKRLDPLLLSALHPAISYGEARDGRLLFGVQMTPSPGVHVLHPKDAWATRGVIRKLRAAAAAVRAAHPGGMDLVVLDISQEHGGRFPPHVTHQQGRDVDTRYYLKGVAPGDHSLHFVTADKLDCPRVWALIRAVAPDAEVLYMDYKLQKVLYRYLHKTLKMSPAQLRPILSYPNGHRVSGALVQHVKGHWNHLHIRFKAPLAALLGALWSREEIEHTQRRLDARRYGRYQHTIRRGETLGSIAKAHKVSLRDLMRWNHLGARSVLRPGRALDIRVQSID